MKIIKFLLVAVVFALLLNQCRYSFIVPEEIPIIDPKDPNTPQVSFAKEIVPIFVNGENCTSCHATGKQLPDLSADKAFASINSTRYINKTTPEQSKIYTYLSPENSSQHQKKYTAAQAAKVLLWIQQGAKNN